MIKNNLKQHTPAHPAVLIKGLGTNRKPGYSKLLGQGIKFSTRFSFNLIGFSPDNLQIPVSASIDLSESRDWNYFRIILEEKFILKTIKKHELDVLEHLRAKLRSMSRYGQELAIKSDTLRSNVDFLRGVVSSLRGNN
jgi:hypothetical protein